MTGQHKYSTAASPRQEAATAHPSRAAYQRQPQHARTARASAPPPRESGEADEWDAEEADRRDLDVWHSRLSTLLQDLERERAQASARTHVAAVCDPEPVGEDGRDRPQDAPGQPVAEMANDLWTDDPDPYRVLAGGRRRSLVRRLKVASAVMTAMLLVGAVTVLFMAGLGGPLVPFGDSDGSYAEATVEEATRTPRMTARTPTEPRQAQANIPADAARADMAGFGASEGASVDVAQAPRPENHANAGDANASDASAGVVAALQPIDPPPAGPEAGASEATAGFASEPRVAAADQAGAAAAPVAPSPSPSPPQAAVSGPVADPAPDPAPQTAAQPPAQTAAEPPVATASAPTRGSEVTEFVNMRAEPDNDADVLTVVPQGGSVDVVACAIWCEVIHEGQRGWIFNRFVADSGQTAATQ